MNDAAVPMMMRGSTINDAARIFWPEETSWPLSCWGLNLHSPSGGQVGHAYDWPDWNHLLAARWPLDVWLQDIRLHWTLAIRYWQTEQHKTTDWYGIHDRSVRHQLYSTNWQQSRLWMRFRLVFHGQLVCWHFPIPHNVKLDKLEHQAVIH